MNVEGTSNCVKIDNANKCITLLLILDVDECRINQLLCENGQCYNFQGGYRCVCNMGFSATEDERACVGKEICIFNLFLYPETF